MPIRPRYLEPQVRRDLRRKMVFVSGPRQVGKTTLARRLLARKAGYLNWDATADREAILRGQLPVSDFWVFDEIHKDRLWRRFLKGLYDTRRAGVVPGEAQRFENLVGAHLLKWVHFVQDTEGREVELRYFRDVDGREVDFVVVEGRRPTHLVECKWADAPVDRGLRYLKQRFPDCQAWQLSAIGTKDFVSPEGIRVSPALELLRRLP